MFPEPSITTARPTSAIGVPARPIVTTPPVPKPGSSVPFSSKRATTIDFGVASPVPVCPTATSLPSDCRASARTNVNESANAWLTPSVPKLSSRSPLVVKRAMPKPSWPDASSSTVTTRRPSGSRTTARHLPTVLVARPFVPKPSSPSKDEVKETSVQVPRALFASPTITKPSSGFTASPYAQ